MKRFMFLLFFLMISAPLFAENLTLSGYLKNETALRMTKNQHTIDKFKNIFKISGEQKINDNWTAFVSGRYWYDSAYSWYDKLDRAQHYMQNTQRIDWLRDCYLDFTSEKLDVRLGRQQVAWGQANGLTVLDRVNPVDLTEFWLQDFVDLRIPLWMANIKYSPKVDSSLQLLVIPDFEESTAAPPGAPFVFRSRTLFDEFKKDWDTNPNPVITIPSFLRTPLRVNTFYPSKEFKNAKFGLQWQDIIAGWQYTLNYLHGYDPLARTYHEGTDTTVLPPNVGLVYGRRFKIVQVVGGSLNHTFTDEKCPLKGITFRGDAAVYLNEPTYFGDVTSGDAKGTSQWNNVFWLMGLDKTVFTKWLLSFQFAQYILEHARPDDPAANGQNWDMMNAYSYGAEDQIENIFTLKIATNFMHERLLPEINLNLSDDGDGRITPKVVYQLRDNLWFTLGLHYFYGDEQDTFGQFTKSKQAFVNIKYTF